VIIDNFAAYKSQVVKFCEEGTVGNAGVDVAVGGMDGDVQFAVAPFRRRCLCFGVAVDWHRFVYF